MVALFEGLCTAAGLIAEKPAPARPARSPNFTPQQRATARRIVHERLIKPARQNSSNIPTELPAAITGLLASLPAQGSGWTKPKRDLFMTTFGTVLDFCFPIVEEFELATETTENSGQAAEATVKRRRVP